MNAHMHRHTRTGTHTKPRAEGGRSALFGLDLRSKGESSPDSEVIDPPPPLHMCFISSPHLFIWVNYLGGGQSRGRQLGIRAQPRSHICTATGPSVGATPPPEPSPGSRHAQEGQKKERYAPSGPRDSEREEKATHACMSTCILRCCIPFPQRN